MASKIDIRTVQRELGRNIRSVRDSLELSQEEAASTAGIDYKRFQRIEAGEVNVTLRTMVQLANAFDLSFWELVANRTNRSSSMRGTRRKRT